MNRLLKLILAMICIGNTVVAQVHVSNPTIFDRWVHVNDSLRSSRGFFDATFSFPRGCGAPSGTASLHDGDASMPALYYDSCGHKTYVFDPSTATWHIIASEVFNSFAEMRAIGAPKDNFIYRFKYNNTIGDFYYDPADVTSPDDSAMVFVTGEGKRLKRLVANQVDARWFGANPADNAQDDYPYLQRAINWCIKYRSHGTLYIPAGVYLLSKGLLVLRDDNNDGISEFVSLDITGDKIGGGDATGAPWGNGGETVLFVNNQDDFGIGVQRGKTMSIRNIAIAGKNDAGYNINTYTIGNTTTESFLKTGIRNNRYSPYAGIVIDPFGVSAVLPDNRYPERTSLYNEAGNGGSSAIAVEGCFIRGFAVGIMNSPNGTTQNAEAHTFEDIWLENCVSAIANGNSQARTINCKNIKCWGGTMVVFDHQRYGDGTSSAMYVQDANIAGSNKYLVATTNWGIGYNHQFKDTHIESLWAIGGDIVNGTQHANISFKNCQIDLCGEAPNVQRRAPIFAWCSTLELQDSFIGYYSASDASIMFCNAGMVILKNCTGNLISTQGPYESTVFRSHSLNTGDRPHYIMENGNGLANEIQLTPGLELFKNGYLTFASTGFQMKQKYLGKALNTYGLNGMFTPLSVDAVNSIAVFNVGPQIYKCAPGAYVATLATDDFGVSRAIGAGVISSVNVTAQTITVVKLSAKITASSSVYLVMASPAKLHSTVSFFIGDITASSPVITNIEGELGTPANTMQAGQYFNHPAFLPGTYIVSATGNSVTLSTGALYSETGAFVLNETLWENTGVSGELQTTFASFYNKTMFKEGDIIRMGYSNNSGNLDTNKLAFVCIKAGMFTTSRPPKFKTVYANPLVTTDSVGTAPHAYYMASDGTLKKGAFPQYLAHVLRGTLTYDFPGVAANSSAVTTVTITGAAPGDLVAVTKTGSTWNNGETYSAFVSAANTVTLRLNNNSGSSIDLASETYQFIIFKY
jgi:hypothetical protein